MSLRQRKTARSALLAGSLLTSLTVHAAGFAWFYSSGPAVQIAAGQASTITIVGSLEDLVAGSKAATEVEPPEKQAEPIQNKLIEPVKPETEPMKSAALAPVPAQMVEGITQKAEIAPVKPVEAIQPQEVLRQVSEVKPPEKTVPLPVEQAKPVEPKKLEEVQEPVQPQELAELEQVSHEVEELEPEELKAERVDQKELAELQEEAPEAEVVPLPRKAPPRPKLKQVAEKAKTARKAGNAQINQRKGAATATAGARKASAGGARQGSSDSAGNADKDNYLGKVHNKLKRAAEKAYPRWEKKRGRQGTVKVSFTIQQDGSVTNIAITRPSGNKRLDQAALKTVSRAAPFGKAPFASSRQTVDITFRTK